MEKQMRSWRNQLYDRPKKGGDKLLIEALLKNQIIENQELSGMLAAVDGNPAFFYKKMPTAAGPGTLYPYVIYDVKMRESSIQNVRGTLLLSVYFGNDSNFDEAAATALKQLELTLINVISGTFYTANAQAPSVCAIWNHSKAIKPNINGEGNSETTQAWGVKLSFDLMSLPMQTTTDPDPIRTMREWSASTFNSAKVIPCNSMPCIWQPTTAPAIYWRLSSLTVSDDQSHNTAWLDCQITGHVIMPSATDRITWLKTIAEELSIVGEIPITAETTLSIKKMEVNPEANQLFEGQITITGSYGLTRKESDGWTGHRLMNVNTTHDGIDLSITRKSGQSNNGI